MRPQARLMAAMPQQAFDLKIRANPLVNPLDALTKNLPPVLAVDDKVEVARHPECFYPAFEKVTIEGPTCKAMNKNIRHSVWKLAVVAKAVKGMHIYDA